MYVKRCVHRAVFFTLTLILQLIYSCFAQVLVKEKGYDPTLLEDDFDDLKDFWYGHGLLSSR